MKLATIALATAFALQTTFAFAEGTLNYSTFAARPIVRGVTLTRPIAAGVAHLSHQMKNRSAHRMYVRYSADVHGDRR
jgi:hypothetical protein